MNLHSATNSANLLNQYSYRTVPGFVDVMGSATNTATVTVNNQPAYRNGDYFRAELSFDNTPGPLYPAITNLAVLNNGTNADILAMEQGNVLLAKTPEAFTCDAEGNLTSDSLWTNRWNGENRLNVVESRGAVPAAGRRKEEWSYLPDGRWSQRIVSKWDTNTLAYQPWITNRFVWDGQVLLAVLDHANAPMVALMRGLDLSGLIQGAGGVGGVLAVTQGTNGTHFAAYDGNGNVSALVDSEDETVTAQYEYDPFGKTLRATGPMARANPIRFSTQYADDVTDDVKYLYREYNPSTGRWLSRDPVAEKGGLNLYGFVRNAPLDRSDKLGLECVCGPDVTEWFKQEIANTVQTLNQVEKNYNYAGELLWIKDHGLEIQFKSMNFQTAGCATSDCKDTVWLSGHCIHKSELGNIILGFWVSYLDHTAAQLLYGVNWVDKQHPGEGANDAADVGGLAFGFYMGGNPNGGFDQKVPPYSQSQIDDYFTPGKWREGFSDPWGTMSAKYKTCQKCSKTWQGPHHPIISPKRK